MATVEERIAVLETNFINQKETDKRHDKYLAELYTKAEGSFKRIDELKETIGVLKTNFENLNNEIKKEIGAGEKKFQHNKESIANAEERLRSECLAIREGIEKKFKQWSANGEKKKHQIWNNLKWVLATGIAIFALLH